MIRQRCEGELISGGDVVLIGDKAFAVLGTLLVGQVVLRGTVNAVYTSEPVTTLQEPFPARPAKPACENCGEPSTHVREEDYEPKQYLCKECFDEAEHNDERNERAVNAY